jgi:ADP-heptose:LPS heptosyltransferase
MKITVPGSGYRIGDQIALLPTLAEIRRRWPKELIKIVGSARLEIFQEFHNTGTVESGREIRITATWPPGASNQVESFAFQAGVQLVDLTPELKLTAAERAQDFGIDWRRPTVAIDTWATEAARRWPIERYRELSAALTARGFTVLETGSEHVAPFQARERIAASRSFLNKLTVRETAALYSRCSLFIGTDSGGFHLAASVGCPQVVLFSFVNHPRRSYWSTVPIQVRACACAPKKWSERDCNGAGATSAACLAEVGVERVLDAVGVAEKRFRRGAPA